MEQKKIESQVLKLAPQVRAQLIDCLIESLNPETEKEIERLWIDEAKRRIREWERGRVKAIPAEKVFKRIRARLK